MSCVLAGRGGELPWQSCCSERDRVPNPQPQAQVLLFRPGSGAGGSVFSTVDDQCTCTFVVVTQELEIPLLGCTDYTSLVLFLALSTSRPFSKNNVFVSAAAPCTSRSHPHVNTGLRVGSSCESQINRNRGLSSHGAHISSGWNFLILMSGISIPFNAT